MYVHHHPSSHYQTPVPASTFDYQIAHIPQYNESYTFNQFTSYPATEPSSMPQTFMLDAQMTSYIPQQFNRPEPSKQPRMPALTAAVPAAPDVPVVPRLLPSVSSSPAPRLSRPRVQPPTSAKQSQFHNPYARLAKKDEVKRRRIWNHAFEKAIFSPYELSTINAPNRRKIYISSLEHHIDHMHQILADMGQYPVEEEELDRHVGLNRKTAKSMVSGLFHDSSVYKLQLLELARANGDLQKILASFPPAHC